MRKVFFILLCFFWAMPSGFAQLKIHSFEEAEKLSRENPKPIVAFIHTSWCKYCKMMENSSFKNADIITSLNTSFYFVSLDAESKNDIAFNNHIFKYKPTGQNTGIHELAIQLGTIENQINYPVLCILNDKNEIIFQYNNFLSPADFKIILDKFL